MAKKSKSKRNPSTKCAMKRVCRVSKRAPASPKQIAWRKKFARAAAQCRANQGSYGKCMEKALSTKGL